MSQNNELNKKTDELEKEPEKKEEPPKPIQPPKSLSEKPKSLMDKMESIDSSLKNLTEISPKELKKKNFKMPGKAKKATKNLTKLMEKNKVQALVLKTVGGLGFPAKYVFIISIGLIIILLFLLVGLLKR